MSAYCVCGRVMLLTCAATKTEDFDYYNRCGVVLKLQHGAGSQSFVICIFLSVGCRFTHTSLRPTRPLLRLLRTLHRQLLVMKDRALKCNNEV